MLEVKSEPARKISLQDEAFDAEKTDRYHLSLLDDGNELSCAVLDKDENKYIYLSNEVNQNILPSGWNSVSFAVAHNKFTLIPNALFDEENTRSLLGFNHEIKEDEEVEVNTLHNVGAKNLFTIKKNLILSVRKQFPNVKFIHSTTSFIESVMKINKNSSGKKAFANFIPRTFSNMPVHKEKTQNNETSFFEMVILNGKDLLFCNSFKYHSAEEIAYYILFVYEQLGLNTETVELTLSGGIEKISKEHSLLYDYIRHVKFASRPEEFRYSHKFEEIPGHRFYSLLTQYLVQ